MQASGGRQRDCPYTRHTEELALVGSAGAFYNSVVAETSRPMIHSERLLQAYRFGIFPMGMEDGSISWFSPDPRGVLPLALFHLPHATQKEWLRGHFEIRINESFGEVIRACAARRDTWINEEIIASYEQLHRLGYAHSVETWLNGKLAGGLYGVAIGGAFFGESMFHSVTNASKIALAGLVERMRAREFSLLDIQWVTPHLQQFGALEVPRGEYLILLEQALRARSEF